MKKTTKRKEQVNFVSEPLMYLFNEGKHYNVYKMLGAHKEKQGRKKDFCKELKKMKFIRTSMPF